MLRPMHAVVIEPIEEPTITENKSPSGLLYLPPTINVSPWSRGTILKMPEGRGHDPYGVKVGEIVHYRKQDVQKYYVMSEDKEYTLVPEALLHMVEEDRDVD